MIKVSVKTELDPCDGLRLRPRERERGGGIREIGDPRVRLRGGAGDPVRHVTGAEEGERWLDLHGQVLSARAALGFPELETIDADADRRLLHRRFGDCEIRFVT